MNERLKKAIDAAGPFLKRQAEQIRKAMKTQLTEVTFRHANIPAERNSLSLHLRQGRLVGHGTGDRRRDIPAHRRGRLLEHSNRGSRDNTYPMEGGRMKHGGVQSSRSGIEAINQSITVPPYLEAPDGRRFKIREWNAKVPHSLTNEPNPIVITMEAYVQLPDDEDG